MMVRHHDGEGHHQDSIHNENQWFGPNTCEYPYDHHHAYDVANANGFHGHAGANDRKEQAREQ